MPTKGDETPLTPMQPGVSFILRDGQLGRRDLNRDGVSAMLFCDMTPPSSMDAVVLIGSLKEAEDLGITADRQVTETQPDHYHIQEFFRRNPNGTLYVSYLADSATAGDILDAITAMQTFAKGAIRMFALPGSYGFNATKLGEVTTALDDFYTQKQGAIALVECATTPRANTKKYISRITGQDVTRLRSISATAPGGVLPGWLTNTSCVGTVLGELGAVPVSESIAFVRNHDLSTSDNFQEIGFTDGTLLAAKTVSQLNTMNDAGDIYVRIYPNNAGAYCNDNHTQALATSDYRYITDTRTMLKAQRELDTLLTNEISNRVPLNPDGTLSDDYVKSLEGAVKDVLLQMQSSGDLSGFDAFIDPNQNVLANSTIKVRVRLLPVGHSRYIEVDLGYTTQTT